MQVVRISGDGLKAVAKVAELMVADMAVKSCAIAQGHKRRTIKLCDVEQTGDTMSVYFYSSTMATLHAHTLVIVQRHLTHHVSHLCL
jgi:hypothetical protein